MSESVVPALSAHLHKGEVKCNRPTPRQPPERAACLPCTCRGRARAREGGRREREASERREERENRGRTGGERGGGARAQEGGRREREESERREEREKRGRTEEKEGGERGRGKGEGEREKRAREEERRENRGRTGGEREKRARAREGVRREREESEKREREKRREREEGKNGRRQRGRKRLSPSPQTPCLQNQSTVLLHIPRCSKASTSRPTASSSSQTMPPRVFRVGSVMMPERWRTDSKEGPLQKNPPDYVLLYKTREATPHRPHRTGHTAQASNGASHPLPLLFPFFFFVRTTRVLRVRTHSETTRRQYGDNPETTRRQHGDNTETTRRQHGDNMERRSLHLRATPHRCTAQWNQRGPRPAREPRSSPCRGRRAARPSGALAPGARPRSRRSARCT